MPTPALKTIRPMRTGTRLQMRTSMRMTFESFDYATIRKTRAQMNDIICDNEELNRQIEELERKAEDQAYSARAMQKG